MCQFSSRPTFSQFTSHFVPLFCQIFWIFVKNRKVPSVECIVNNLWIAKKWDFFRNRAYAGKSLFLANFLEKWDVKFEGSLIVENVDNFCNFLVIHRVIHKILTVEFLKFYYSRGRFFHWFLKVFWGAKNIMKSAFLSWFSGFFLF